MTSARIIITEPALLYAAALHQSTESARYCLQGVRIEPYRDADGLGARIVATDGHRLSAGFDAGAWIAEGALRKRASGVTLPVDKSLFRHLTHKLAARVEWDGATMAVLTETGTVLGLAPCREIDGTFLDWRRVLPDECSGKMTHAFNASYLALYEKIAKAFADGRRAPFVVITPNGGGPARVTLSGVPQWYGVLMPVHGGPSVARLPDWIAENRPAMREAEAIDA